MTSPRMGGQGGPLAFFAAIDLSEERATMEPTPPFLQNAYVARYAPGLAAKYRRANTVFGSVSVAILLAVLVGSVLTSRGWFAYLAFPLAFGIGAVACLVTARQAENKWNADNRLALAVSDAGLGLPRLGTIAWAEVRYVRIYDHSLTPRGISPFTTTVTHLLGTDSTMFVDVFVTDSEAVLARAGNPPKVLRALDADKKVTGFKGVWGQGMFDPVFQDAVRALVTAAEGRGVAVTYDVTNTSAWYMPRTNQPKAN
ncbi:hypothetical protein E3O06_00865 [Cryobacterium glaciale]|uniref:Uncharacterized protein n=1 Tax=Cryobacterium glaciale TaxID=1259145 RepID=A0A4V6QGC5_9MICO|nr:hypothetical protein [Cryobacterium glaciale]TFB77337.1 hypothetical protein E3O06_00865 [Cryobacterium glaciale]